MESNSTLPASTTSTNPLMRCLIESYKFRREIEHEQGSVDEVEDCHRKEEPSRVYLQGVYFAFALKVEYVDVESHHQNLEY